VHVYDSIITCLQKCIIIEIAEYKDSTLGQKFHKLFQ